MSHARFALLALPLVLAALAPLAAPGALAIVPGAAAPGVPATPLGVCVTVYDFPDAGYALCADAARDCRLSETETTFLGSETRCLATTEGVVDGPTYYCTQPYSERDLLAVKLVTRGSCRYQVALLPGLLTP